MPTIVVSTAGTTVSVDNSHFTLRAQGRKICRIPPSVIDQMVVFHDVDITRKALDRLAVSGIPVTFLGREGRVQARLVPAWKFDATPRIGQAKAYLDLQTRTLLARRLIDAKIANGAAMIRQHASNYPDPGLADAQRTLKEMRDALHQASSIEEMMGMEGMAGRIYFSALAKMIRVEWTEFKGRNRRPPLDPVNAVLSYAYAVLMHQLLSYLECVGVDPYLGYLHTVEPRRPTLALDLMEPFRPMLGDRLMLRLLNLGTLRQEHFGEWDGPGHGILINYEGRTAFLKVFMEWSQEGDQALGHGWKSPGRLLLLEAEKFAALAKQHTLDQFKPFYQNSDDAEAAP